MGIIPTFHFNPDWLKYEKNKEANYRLLRRGDRFKLQIYKNEIWSDYTEEMSNENMDAYIQERFGVHKNSTDGKEWKIVY